MIDNSSDFIYKVPFLLKESTGLILKGGILLVILLVTIFFINKLVKSRKRVKQVAKGLTEEDVLSSEEVNKKSRSLFTKLSIVLLLVWGFGGYLFYSINSYINLERFGYSEEVQSAIVKLDKQEGVIKKIKSVALSENSSTTYLFKGYNKDEFNNRYYGQYETNFNDIYRMRITVGSKDYIVDAKVGIAGEDDVNKIEFYKDKKGNMLNAKVYVNTETFAKLPTK